MKHLLPLIFVTLLLAGCTSQGSTKMTDDQIFQKKQECAGYKGKMEKDSTGEVVIDIFYSPVRNSCIYITNTADSHSIKDFLSKEYISHNALKPLSDDVQLQKDWLDKDLAFYAKIKELKGE